MNFDSEPLALDSNLDDFHFDLDGSDEFYNMLKSSKTSSGGADSRAEMERMLFEVDEYSSPPSFINSSSLIMNDEPALPTEEPKTNNMLLLDAYNPCRTTHRRAIIKDEELVNDINFNTHGAALPPSSSSAYPKKRKGRGKTREGYKQSRRVSCSDMDTLGMTSSTPFTSSHSSLNQLSPPPRRATVGCDQAPSLAELFGNSSSSGGLANAMSSAGILQEPMPSDPLGEAEGEMVNPTLEYHEALQKLAASMKRSELSRRQVMMQRNTHQHYQAHQVRNQVLTSIEQEQQRAATFGNTSPVSVADSSSVENNRNISPTFPALPDKATIMKDFFSGSRGTLTNGLENSRMALRVYASEMYGKDPYNPYVMRRTSM